MSNDYPGSPRHEAREEKILRRHASQGAKGAQKKMDMAKRMRGNGEHSHVTFTPKSKSEERLFNKTFKSKTA